MANDLQYTVGADVSNATKAMDSLVKNVTNASSILTKQLERLQKIASLPNLSVKQYERLQAMMFKTKGELDRLQAGFQKFGKGTTDATNTLTNFSRIAGDASYGIIGIANNISPAIESFQQLQKQTGSTQGAFKALVSSLSGAGGIIFGVNVLTSLLVSFGDKLFGAGEKAKYLGDDLRLLAKEAENTKKYIQDLGNEVNFLNKVSGVNIRIRGGGDIDVMTREIERFKFNVQELQESVLPGLEKDLRELTAREVNAPIGSDELKQVQEAQKAKQEAYDAAIKQASDFRKDIIILEGNVALERKRIAEEELKEQQEKNKRIAEENRKALEEYKRIWGRYKIIAAQAILDMGKLDIALIPDVKDVEAEGRRYINQFLNGIRRGMEKMNTSPGISGSDLAAGEMAFQEFLRQGGQTATMMLQQQQQKAQALAATLSDIVTPAFTNMFDAIFEGRNAIQGFFQGIAQSLKGLLARLAAAVVQALALRAIFSVLFPGSVFAKAGGFGKLLQGLIGFAEGGVVFGPTAALIGEGRGTSRSNPEVVAPLDRLKSMLGNMGGASHLTGEFTVRGKDLVYVLAQNNQSQGRRFGG